jgi:hypothetical protein
MLVSCLAYSTTLTMEATCSSKMSVDFRQTTQHYNPEKSIHFSVLFPSNQTAHISYEDKISMERGMTIYVFGWGSSSFASKLAN